LRLVRHDCLIHRNSQLPVSVTRSVAPAFDFFLMRCEPWCSADIFFLTVISLDRPVCQMRTTLLFSGKTALAGEKLGFASCSSNWNDDTDISNECCVIVIFAGQSFQRADLPGHLGCTIPATRVSASRTRAVPAPTTLSGSASDRRKYHDQSGLGRTWSLHHVAGSHDGPCNPDADT